jgi:hypothetical protein
MFEDLDVKVSVKQSGLRSFIFIPTPRSENFIP